MTPLVDVMLVLVVIFLVTAPMLNSAIKLNLPSQAASEITEQKSTSISINKFGEYFLDDQQITISELKKSLKILAKKNPKQQIHLRADIETPYGKVSEVLSTSQQVGLSNIGFITEPK